MTCIIMVAHVCYCACFRASNDITQVPSMVSTILQGMRLLILNRFILGLITLIKIIRKSPSLQH